MALDERYIPLNSLNSYFVDKDTGLPLAGGKLYFYEDSNRAVAKSVYQLSGSYGNYSYTSVSNELTLSSVGTVQDSGGNNIMLYAYPYDDNGDIDLYYIVCENSGGVTQWTRSAVPNLTSGNNPLASTYSYNNELSNPQFTEYFFENETETTFTFASAVSQEIPIAPDWTLVVSGSGSVILTRFAVAGSSNVPTAPAYYLQLDVSANITTCYLRQRFSSNSGLWSNGFLSSYIVAKRLSGSASSSVEMIYSPSSGTATSTLLSTAITEDFAAYYATEEIGASDNSQSGTNSYTDIIVSLPAQAVTAVTSIQVVPTPAAPGGDLVPYDERSANHELAFMANYYTPRLIQLQQNNLLTGWDFKLNPAQFAGLTEQTISVDSSVGSGFYIWDQTIAGRTTADVNVTRNSLSKGIQMTTTATPATTDSFYLLQYLDGEDAQKVIGNPLAINVSAYKGDIGGNVVMRVYLYGATASSQFPLLSDIITQVNSSGIASLTSSASSDGWFEISRSNMNTAQATLTTVSSASDLNTLDYDYQFNGWELSGAQIADFDKFAIVVTFTYVTDATVITVDSINLVPGDLCYRPLPETKAEVLKRCQYYYERSYEVGTNSGTATNVNQYTYPGNSLHSSATGDTIFFTQAFQLEFTTVKRTEPMMAFINPTLTTVNTIRGSVFNNTTETLSANYTFSSAFTLYSNGTKRLMYNAQPDTIGTAAGKLRYSPLIRFHYIADARLGIV